MIFPMGIAGTEAGRGLRSIREVAGMTLAQVAEAAGTSESYLSRVENGHVVATRQYIGRVTGAIADRFKQAAA